MVPGLTIDVEGVGNAKGQLDASKISFDPDTFAVEVAEEQQIEANKAAAAQAQSTANQGVPQLIRRKRLRTRRSSLPTRRARRPG